MITAATYSSEAEMRAAYKAAMPARPVQRQQPARSRLVEIKPDADQHVAAYRVWRRMQTDGTMPAEFIRLACQIMAYDHTLIMSRRRKRSIVSARYELIRLTHQRYPKLSSPKLGRLFRRDHTVVLYALHKDGRVRKNTAKLTPEQVMEIKALAATGDFLMKDIAKDFGVAPSTISNIVHGRVWRGLD